MPGRPVNVRCPAGSTIRQPIARWSTRSPASSCSAAPRRCCLKGCAAVAWHGGGGACYPRAHAKSALRWSGLAPALRRSPGRGASGRRGPCRSRAHHANLVLVGRDPQRPPRAPPNLLEVLRAFEFAVFVVLRGPARARLSPGRHPLHRPVALDEHWRGSVFERGAQRIFSERRRKLRQIFTPSPGSEKG